MAAGPVRELLIGAGSSRVKKISMPGRQAWQNLTTLDFNTDHGADVAHDLAQVPLPFDDDSFDEIHAYEVLEHVGQQGDFRFFFAQWMDFWRMLKPGGYFIGTSPHPTSVWAWGDPGHTRIVAPECFVFLNQPQYTAQVGVTAMSDYRFCFRGDFDVLHLKHNAAGSTEFVLQAVKPSRISL